MVRLVLTAYHTTEIEGYLGEACNGESLGVLNGGVPMCVPFSSAESESIRVGTLGAGEIVHFFSDDGCGTQVGQVAESDFCYPIPAGAVSGTATEITAASTSQRMPEPRINIQQESISSGDHSTIPVNLVIYHGFINKYLEDNVVQLGSLALDERTIFRQVLQLHSSMTKGDFEAELEEQIHSHFGVDMTAYKKAHGGKSAPRHIDCAIDIEGSGKEDKLTRINVLNEESWKAAKALMRVASGDTEIKVVFAVQKGKFWVRMLIGLFMLSDNLRDSSGKRRSYCMMQQRHIIHGVVLHRRRYSTSDSSMRNRSAIIAGLFRTDLL
nr:hypothetical protein CFP56_22393 [Quercus suber]